MCCGHSRTLDLPPAALEMLARYRDLQRRHGWNWGEEVLPLYFRWARFERIGAVMEHVGEDGGPADWAAAVRAVVGAGPPPAGLVIIDGTRVRTGPPRPLIAGHTVPIDVVRDGDIETVDVDAAQAPFHGAVALHPAAELHLRTPECARWSVTDATGGAWFPDGVAHKWDVHGRPYFHAADVTMAVPDVPLTVVCARGLEFGVQTFHLERPGVVDADPPRLFDPAAAGWYGADLHVHLNYSGDRVRTPADAARMQHGEGLHLMNLLAGNFTGDRVYDRELLESTAGRDLWHDGVRSARMGVEYRNDLLGHLVALGPAGMPQRFHTGHEHSSAHDDWPPNAAACADLRSLGATVGYPHPSWTAFPADWSTDRFFAAPRSVEARELVADAALGLVDAIDLISPFDDEGAVFLYHRLLSCGIRLAATAGTDVFLSFAHGPGTASNPPGWGRVYADLRGAPPSVPAFQDAIRAGRTVVTNGPWLSLTVDGHGPGSVLDRAPGDRLHVEVRSTVPATLVGPDGEITVTNDTVVVDRPTWIAAVARAPRDERTLDETAFAHTTAVYVDVDGRRVGRERDARWCLEYLDRLESFVSEHGRFSHSGQRDDLAGVLDEARAYYRRVTVGGGFG